MKADNAGSAVLTQVTCRLEDEGRHFKLGIDLHLNRCVFDNGLLALSCESIPVSFQNITSTVGTVGEAVARNGMPTVTIDVGNGRPSEMMVSGYMEWVPSATNTLPWLPWFVIPDFLPSPDIAIPALQPNIFPHMGGNLRGLRFESGMPHRTMQLGLMEHSGMNLIRDGRLFIGSELPLSASQSQRAKQNVRRVNGLLEELFGLEPKVESLFAALTAPNLVRDPGGVVTAASPELVIPPAGRETIASRYLALQLARTWWGIGVRVPGDLGAVLTHGLCLWAAARLETRDGADSATHWLHGLRKDIRSDVHRAQARAAGQALDLCSADRSDVLRVVRTLTRKYWGWTVPWHVLVEEIRQETGLPTFASSERVSQ